MRLLSASLSLIRVQLAINLLLVYLVMCVSFSSSLAIADESMTINYGVDPPSRQLADKELQNLKLSVVDLAIELFNLRDEIQAPTSNQLAVFLSVDVGEYFGLNTVQLKIDDQAVLSHLYTVQQVQALLRGGSQRLYIGNLRDGEHELVAIFLGRGTHGRDYRRAVQLKFQKLPGPKYVELRITDRKILAQPVFEIKEWQ